MPVEQRHRPIRDLVRRIRRETGAAVPDVDPEGPGTEARVVVVLRDPGRLGALKTSVLSPLKNDDRTAANQRALFAEAKLPVESCLFWNAIPWDLGGRSPKSADLRRGARYLSDLIAVMKAKPAPVIVACGNEARDACAEAGLEAIAVCHPSQRGLFGGGFNRRDQHVAGLRLAARRARRLPS